MAVSFPVIVLRSSTHQTIAQTQTSDGRRGRVMSLWLLVAIGGTSLGAIGIGVLSDLIGIRSALLAVTAACVTHGAVIAFRARRRTQLARRIGQQADAARESTREERAATSVASVCHGASP